MGLHLGHRPIFGQPDQPRRRDRHALRMPVGRREPADGGHPDRPQTNDKKVTSPYDHLARPVEKKVYEWTESGWSATPALVRRFVWSGWLLLMELDGNNNVVRKYTWGLDLAGQAGQVNSSPQRVAGGDLEGGGIPDSAAHRQGQVGGLLAVDQAFIDYPTPQPDVPAGNYVFTYDANGNVVQVLDLSAGSVSAALPSCRTYVG